VEGKSGEAGEAERRGKFTGRRGIVVENMNREG
jgi:hypothetical protein